MAATKPSLPKYNPPRPNAWLWKLAGVIVLVAAAIVFIMARDLPNEAVEANIRRVIAFALLCVGICAISATAGRWLKR